MIDPERLDLPSASSFAIDVACAGRQNLLRSLPLEALKEPEPDDDDKAMAERGTRLHKAWQTGDFSTLQDDEELSDYERGRKFKEQAILDWLRYVGGSVSIEERETRLWLHDPKTFAPQISAQLDLFRLIRQYALVLDFKSGWNPYLSPTERSWQLRVQAVVLKAEYPELQEISVGYVKPKGAPGPDFTVYKEADLIHAERDIRFHLWKVQQPDAERVPGPHCRWCKGKPFCKEAAAYSLLPSTMLPTVREGAIDLSKEGIAQMVELMPLADLAIIQFRARIVSNILEAVKLRLKSLTAEQLAAIGLGFGKPRSLKSITETKACFDKLILMGINEDEIWKALEFSNGKLVEALRRDQGWPEKQSKGYVNQLCEQHGEVKDSEPPIVSV